MADGYGFTGKAVSFTPNLYPNLPPESQINNEPRPPYPTTPFPPNMPVPNSDGPNFNRFDFPSHPPICVCPAYPPTAPPEIYSDPPVNYPIYNQSAPPVYPGDNRAYYWIESAAGRVVPPSAVQGGVDQDGTTIYVGRAFHEGDWIPAKVIPDKNVAYVAYGGGEHAKDQYQILCEQHFDWVPCSGSSVPPGAVQGGNTSDGEALYVGRVYHEGSHTVGKVHPSHGTCYIPFGGQEIGFQSYEILILRS